MAKELFGCSYGETLMHEPLRVYVSSLLSVFKPELWFTKPGM
jgi:hypothetical protein